jgi:methyl-accepting chemotaxis protein
MRLAPLFAVSIFLLSVSAAVVALSQLTGFDPSWPGQRQVSSWLQNMGRRLDSRGTLYAVQASYEEKVAQVRVAQAMSILQASEAESRIQGRASDVDSLAWASPALKALVNGESLAGSPPGTVLEDPGQTHANGGRFLSVTLTRLRDGRTLRHFSDGEQAPAAGPVAPASGNARGASEGRAGAVGAGPGVSPGNGSSISAVADATGSRGDPLEPPGMGSGTAPAPPGQPAQRSQPAPEPSPDSGGAMSAGGATTAPASLFYDTDSRTCQGTFLASDATRYALAAAWEPPMHEMMARDEPLDHFRPLLIAVLFALLGAAALSSLMTRSISDVARTVGRLRERNLRGATMPGSYVREVQEIALGVAELVDLLAETVTRIRSVQDFARSMAETLRHSAGHLAEHGRRLRAQGGSLRDSVARARRGHGEIGAIAASVGQAARTVLADARALMEQFAGSAVRLQAVQSAQNALLAHCRRIYRVTQSAASDLKEGGHAIERAMDSLRNAHGAVEAIGDRVDKISGIAEQTNLLALNAAIQAASGGEKGKSFALVAEEVRKLADLSSETTKEIVLQVQATLERITDGQQNLAEVFGVFHRIEEGVAELDRVLVSTASALDQIQRDLGAIGEICQKVGEVAPLLVRESEAQGRSIGELIAQADQIGRSSADLESHVQSLFELADRSGREADNLDRLSRDLVDKTEGLRSALEVVQVDA